jgi:Icc-related predicted phosphoesterase
MTMRRFLVCGGFQGRDKSLEHLRRTVEKRPPDGILVPGGILKPQSPRTTPWGLTKEEGVYLERFFETLGKLNLFAAVIPGPDDSLADFLRIGMHVEIEFPGIRVVHATLIEKRDVAFCGVGGCLAEKGPADPASVSRTMAEYHLRTLWAAEQPRKVLLLSVPPRGKLGGPDGSSLSEYLIDSYHPSLCVVGGHDEKPASDRVAHTLIVSPGQISEGHAVWVDWTRAAEDVVEAVDVHDIPQTIPVDTGAGD